MRAVSLKRSEHVAMIPAQVVENRVPVDKTELMMLHDYMIGSPGTPEQSSLTPYEVRRTMWLADRVPGNETNPK